MDSSWVLIIKAKSYSAGSSPPTSANPAEPSRRKFKSDSVGWMHNMILLVPSVAVHMPVEISWTQGKEMHRGATDFLLPSHFFLLWAGKRTWKLIPCRSCSQKSGLGTANRRGCTTYALCYDRAMRLMQEMLTPWSLPSALRHWFTIETIAVHFPLEPPSIHARTISLQWWVRNLPAMTCLMSSRPNWHPVQLVWFWLPGECKLSPPFTDGMGEGVTTACLCRCQGTATKDVMKMALPRRLHIWLITWWVQGRWLSLCHALWGVGRDGWERRKNKTGADGKCQLFSLKQSYSTGKPSQRNFRKLGDEHRVGQWQCTQPQLFLQPALVYFDREIIKKSLQIREKKENKKKTQRCQVRLWHVCMCTRKRGRERHRFFLKKQKLLGTKHTQGNAKNLRRRVVTH